MNRKLYNLMLGYAMIGSMGVMGPTSSGRKTFEDVLKEKEVPNWKKECFREKCSNKRNGNALYCSAECCKADRKERKNRR